MDAADAGLGESNRTAEVTLAFGGEDRVFRLNIGRLRAVQETTDAGPMELVHRLAEGRWRVDDIRATLLHGLIGGGMTSPDATRLMKTQFDDLPIAQFVAPAQAVLMAALVGAPDEDSGEPKGEVVNTPSPAPNSPSVTSTPAAP